MPAYFEGGPGMPAAPDQPPQLSPEQAPAVFQGLTRSYTPEVLRDIPVAGSVLGAFGSPLTYVPFAGEAGFGANIARNVAGQVGGQVASDLAGNFTDNPWIKAGAGLLGGAAVYGGAAAAGRALAGRGAAPALGSIIGDEAQPFPELTPQQEAATRVAAGGQPFSSQSDQAGILSSGGTNPAGSEIAVQGGMTPELQARYGDLQQSIRDNGWTPENQAAYRDITGRNSASTLTRPDESLGPVGAGEQRTAEEVAQGAGNALVKGAGEMGTALPENLPLLKLQGALSEAEVASAEQQGNVSALRSRQAGAFAGAAENGPGGQAGFRQAMGAMRGQAEQATFTPLSQSLEPQEVDALYNQVINHPGSPFERATAGSALGKLLDGNPPTASELTAFGKVFGPEQQASVEQMLKSKGIGVGSNLWDEIKKDPIAAVNNSIRSANTMLDFAFMGRLGPTAGLYDAPVFAKSMGQAWKSLAEPSIAKNVLANVDAYAEASGYLPNVATMQEVGLRAFTSDTNPGLLGRVPLVGRLAGVYQNFMAVLRPQMMQHTVENMVKAGRITAEQAQDPAVLSEIAKGINNITGASNVAWLRQGGGGSSAAQLLLEFPNWVASQVELIARGATNGGLSGQMARTALGRLALTGTAFATGVNLLQGKNPIGLIKNGVPQMAVPGTDLTLDPYGPIGELMQHAVGVVRGGYEGATPNGPTGGVDVAGGAGGAGQAAANWGRGMLSPLAKIASDLMIGSNGIGQATRDTMAHTLGYLGRSVSPFGLSDIGQREPAAAALASAGARGVHEPSASQTFDEIAQHTPYVDAQGNQQPGAADFRSLPRDVQAQLLKDNPSLAADKAGAASDQTKAAATFTQQALSQLSDAGKALDAKQTPSGQPFTGKEWRDAYHATNDALRNQKIGVYANAGTQPGGDPVLDSYYKALTAATLPGGQPDWQAIDQYRAGLPAAANAYIDRMSGLALASDPHVAQYREDTKTLAPYWKLGDQAAADYAQARGLSNVTNKAQLLSALTDYITQARGDTPQTKALMPALLQRAMSPVNTRTGALEFRYLQANPTLVPMLDRWGYHVPTRAEVLSAQGTLGAPQ